MKKIVLLLLISFPIIVVAQNVGIGTTTPTEKLEVKNPLRSTLKVSTNSTSDTSELLLSNKTVNGFGTFYTDFSIKSVREEGLFFSSLSDFPANASANSLVIRPNGNIGIGILPSVKLDVNGAIKLEGLNLFEFGAGIAGKELNAGKIGYNAFGTNALAIVGAGTNSTNRAVYFFAEGGTTFNGPATIFGNTNIAGQLQVNGIPGTTGQVLTSNGTADPAWTDAAYGNSTRFALNINYSGVTTSNTSMSFLPEYNLNPTDVTIAANTFTINKTGLYHFDFYYRVVLSASSQPAFSTSISYPGFSIDLLGFELIPIGISTTYNKNFHFSVDMHIVAPATISLGNSAIGPPGVTGSVFGRLFCHLINQ